LRIIFNLKDVLMKRLLVMAIMIPAVYVGLTTAAVYDEASVYLPFEGTVGISKDSPCWANRGTAGYGETPGVIGEEPLADVPTVSFDIPLLKGQYFDGTTWQHLTTSNAYGYGQFGAQAIDPNTPDTEMELALMNIWSFTVTGWVRDGTYQGRLLAGPGFVLNYTGPTIEVQLHSAADPEGPWNRSNTAAQHFGSLGNWKFFAVTYDGTLATDNLKLYYGSITGPTTLDSVHTVTPGQLTRNGDGNILVLGNAYLDSDRPYIGYMDEIRIWSDGPGLPDEPSNAAVLSIAELEAVRQYDLEVPTVCSEIHRKGQTLAGDVNQDCKVNLEDLSMLSLNWLECNIPGDSNCIENW
jgi:hypothetical protein